MYPLHYYMALQQVGLLPLRPVLPPWKSFIPLSSLSPIQPLGLRSGLPGLALLGIVKGLMASPLPLYCLHKFISYHVKKRLDPIVFNNLISPRKAAGISFNVTGSRHSPTLSRVSKVIVKVLSILGWAYPAGPNFEGSPATLHQLDIPVVDAHEAATDMSSVPPQHTMDMVWYRKGRLSMRPAVKLAIGCTNCVCSWALLPLSYIVLRRTVTHFLGHPGLSSTGLPFRMFDPLADLHNVNFGTIGVLLYRTLLCEALKTAVSLGVSGYYVAVCRYIGVRYFSWGSR